MKDNYITVDQVRYATSVVAKNLDTVTVKTSIEFYKTAFSSDIMFTKADLSNSDDQVDKLTIEFNSSYRACIGSLIYLLSTRMDFSFEVQSLAKISSNPGKVHSEGLVHLFRYIKDNKSLGLKYYADIKYSTLSDLLRQVNIKTENQLMAFSDSTWKDFPYTGRSKGSYIIFFKVDPIDHVTHVPGPIAKSSAESDYKTSCN